MRRTYLSIFALCSIALSTCGGEDPATSDEEAAVPLERHAEQLRLEQEPCGVANPSAAVRAAIKTRLHGQRAATARPAGDQVTLAAADGTVEVYFHNVKKSNGTSRTTDGHISSSVADQVVAKLNRDFAGAGVTFVKAGFDRVVNANWYEVLPLSGFPASEHEIAMKTQLRRGDATALNIYTRGGGSLTSSATFPWDYASDPVRDGTSIHVDSLPRSGVEGDVVTHEVGHWLGQFHTFGGNCSFDNDERSDTPVEASANRDKCIPATRDTCPGHPGLDPIDNFMDYAPTSCQNQRARFTFEQEVYIGEALWLIRMGS